MSKPNPLVVPTGSGGSPQLPRTTVAAAATTTTVTQGKPGTHGASVTSGGSAELRTGSGVTAVKAIASRGYARRSVNLYARKCLDLLSQIEEEENPNQSLNTLCQETYQKLKNAFEKFELENARLLSAIDVTEVQALEAEEIYETLFKEVDRIENEILRKVGDLTPTRALTRLVTSHSDLPETQEPSRVFEPEPKPQFRFRGPPPKAEKETDESALLLMKCLTLSYKPAEHITPFDGTDQFQYTSFRTSFEITDRTMTDIGYSDFEKFLELKKTLRGEALKLVSTLPNLDSSYETALNLLDRFYMNPQNSIKRVTDALNGLPKMTNSIDSIKSFYQELVSVTHAFKALNMHETDMGRSLLLNSVTPKLSNSCCREFFKITQRKRNFGSPMGHDATIADLMDCILFQLQLAQQLRDANQGADRSRFLGKDQQKAGGPTSPFKSFKVASTEQRRESKKYSCFICKKENHTVKECNLIKTLSTKDLFEKILSLNLCKLCFWPHKTAECKFSKQNLCKTCKGRHNSLLHLPTSKVKKIQQATMEGSANALASVRTVKYTSNKEQKMEAVPHVLRAHLSSTDPRDSRTLVVNILFDSGSSINLVSKEVAEHMQLKKLGSLGPEEKQLVVGIGNVPLPVDLNNKVSFILSPLDNSRYESPRMEGFVTEVIDSDLGGLDFDPQKFPHLQNIELSMSMPQKPLKVDILLGEPWVSFFTISAPIRDPALNEPHVVAIETKLGTFLGGSYRPTLRSVVKKI